MQADGQPVAIHHCHDFRAFADLHLAYAIAPFLAGTKLPSRKACAHASLPWASSWLRQVRQIRSHVLKKEGVTKAKQMVK
jgi:hypothetical protein